MLPRNRNNGTRLGWLTLAAGVLVFCCAASVAIGTRDVGWSDIAAALRGEIATVAEAAVATRIPRTFLAAVAGAALGLAGAVLQGVTRNPLADPGILGINTGASLAVVIGLSWFGMASANAYIWTAILGAGTAAVFVYAVGSAGRGGATPLKLALAGAATSVASSAFIIALILPRANMAGGFRLWQIGGVGGATFDRIWQVVPVLIVGFLICLLSGRRLNMLALGDDTAAAMGERVIAARAISALGAVLLCGGTTAVCGPIGFVGLVVPHFCRLLVGVDYRWLLPFSAIAGAILLIAADIVGRVIARPGEVDVGILTAFIGAPVFIWIVRRQRIREL